MNFGAGCAAQSKLDLKISSLKSLVTPMRTFIKNVLTSSRWRDLCFASEGYSHENLHKKRSDLLALA
jgi:hypothetical protein